MLHFDVVVLTYHDDKEVFNNTINSIHKAIETAKDYLKLCDLIIIGDEVKGRGRARDIGWRRGKSEFVVFVDTGVILSNNWFIEIYKAVKKIDGVVWYGDSSEAANPEYVIAKCNEIIYREDLDRRMKHSSYFITRAPKTSNCLFTRKILEEVNGFDTNLTSNEDVEIGYRIWMKGKKIVYIPNAKNKNMHRTQIRSKMKRRWEEGKSLAYNKRKHEKYPINWSMYMLLPYSCFKRFFTWIKVWLERIICLNSIFFE